MGFILYKFSQLSISSLSLGLSANTAQYYPCARLEEIFSLPLSCVGPVTLCSDSLHLLSEELLGGG